MVEKLINRVKNLGREKYLWARNVRSQEEHVASYFSELTSVQKDPPFTFFLRLKSYESIIFWNDGYENSEVRILKQDNKSSIVWE